MERISHEQSASYIPHERRMVLDQLSRTTGQPVFGVIMVPGEQDILAMSGINHGALDYPADRVCIKRVDGKVRSYDLDEGETFIAGYEEIGNYLTIRLDGWRVNASNPATLGLIVSLVDAAKQHEVVVPGFDLDTELEDAWEAVCDLAESKKVRDHEEIVNMLYAVHESELKAELRAFMQTILKHTTSLHEILNQPLLDAYLEVIADSNSTLVELLARLSDTSTDNRG